MNEQAVIAPVRKTVHVKVPIEHAFEVFTSGLTRWWPNNHGIGKKPIQKVLMEPRLGVRIPSTHSMVVVLPAPFGPMSPKISP